MYLSPHPIKAKASQRPVVVLPLMMIRVAIGRKNGTNLIVGVSC